MSVDIIFRYIKENMTMIILIIVFLLILTFFVENPNKNKDNVLSQPEEMKSSYHEFFQEIEEGKKPKGILKKGKKQETENFEQVLEKIKTEEEIKHEQLQAKIKEITDRTKYLKREIAILEERTKDKFIANLADEEKMNYYDNINREIYIKQLKLKELIVEINRLVKEDAMNNINTLEAKMDALQISDGPSLRDIIKTDPRFKSFDMIFNNLPTENINLDVDNYTIIVPTNKAFDRMSPELLRLLFKYDNKMKMHNLLMYHIIPGLYFSYEVENSTPVKTVSKLDLKFTRQNGGLFVNTERVIEEDIIASNGIIHVVDNLLFIPEIVQTFVQPLQTAPVKKGRGAQKQEKEEYYVDIAKISKNAAEEQKKEYVSISRLDATQLDALKGNQRVLMNQLYQIRNSMKILKEQLYERERMNRVFNIVDISKQLGDYQAKFDVIHQVISSNMVDYDKYLKRSEIQKGEYDDLNNSIKALSDAIARISRKESVQNPIYSYRVINYDKVAPVNK